MRCVRQQKDALPLPKDRLARDLAESGQPRTNPIGLRLHHGQRQASSKLVQDPEVTLLALSRP